MEKEHSILELALNLTEVMNSSDRYQRLLRTITNSLPCDAASIMVLEDDHLKSIASLGLAPIIESKKFIPNEHPRLDIILKSSGPVIFPHDSPLKDPFDGLIAHDHSSALNVHSCLGCPLEVEGKVIGILTVDALKPHQFDSIDKDWLKTIAALAGATLQTSKLINQLESMAQMEMRFSQSFVAETNKERELELIGTTPLILDVRKHIEVVAYSNLSILVTGETGVGKEIVARLIHKNSSRASKPLVYVNCAALPENIAESELFGHVKGAFTGAINDRMGKFQLANGGTLFLDEIGELSLPLQAKLLRALQEGEIQRVGTDSLIKVNVRIIAATNRNLKKEEEDGKFRSDLFHRLSVYPINVPPLRERTNDIPLMVNFFANHFQKKLGTNNIRINEQVYKRLKDYPWPGNVRELKNILSRAILKGKNRTGPDKILNLLESDFDFLRIDSPPENTKKALTLKSHLALREATENFQRDFIFQKISEHNNNWSKAANALGLHRSNLHNLAKRLGLKST